MEQVSRSAGQRMYEIAAEMFPLCRSITGDGVRRTHDILRQYLPELKTYEVPSGTQVFDWTVPNEWNCRDAYIADETGRRVVDFRQSNLHVMGYSLPVDLWLRWDELEPHLYVQPDQPDAIPYVTSYYKERWGFCLSLRQKEALAARGGAEKYHVVIDSTLQPGSLTYSECVLPGQTDREILVSTYTCHPSMANNECSGPACSVVLADWVKQQPRRYTYRFVYIPETIGSITYLSRNLPWLKEHVIGGVNLSCVGDDRTFSFVETRNGDSLFDRLMENLLQHHAPGNYRRYSYLERGSDERQYNAPGVDLPVVSFCRSKYGEYPEYHTSADDLQLVSPAGFQGSYDLLTAFFSVLEQNGRYRACVLGEPQLGKRGLYPTVSRKGSYDAVKLRMNFLAYADGRRDLVDMAEKIGCGADALLEEAELLSRYDLVERL